MKCQGTKINKKHEKHKNLGNQEHQENQEKHEKPENQKNHELYEILKILIPLSDNHNAPDPRGWTPIQRKKKHINTHQGKRGSTKENQTESTSNENTLLHINAIKCMKLHMKMRGVLDLFESNKESILIYHLASLEAKNR